jgi:hypothetical protein
MTSLFGRQLIETTRRTIGVVLGDDPVEDTKADELTSRITQKRKFIDDDGNLFIQPF